MGLATIEPNPKNEHIQGKIAYHIRMLYVCVIVLCAHVGVYKKKKLQAVQCM